MTYNIHPLFVHFPIAFLFFYSFLKIIPFQKWFPNVSWKHIERTLLFVGVSGSFVASFTGEIAERLVHPNHQLVEMHSLFASLSIWFYGLILLGEILSLLTTIVTSRFKLILFIKKILENKIISKILALLGLISISITGLLGGVIVYGVSADPVVGFLLRILGITL